MSVQGRAHRCELGCGVISGNGKLLTQGLSKASYHPSHLGLGACGGKGGIHSRLLLGREEARPGRGGGGRQRRRQRRQQGQCRQPRGQPQQLASAGCCCSLLRRWLGACEVKGERAGWACRYRRPNRSDRSVIVVLVPSPVLLQCATAACCRRARLGAAPQRAGLQAACCMAVDMTECL